MAALKAVTLEKYRISFVTDFASAPNQHAGYYGYPSYDFQSTIHRPTDTVIYFLANNEYHQYCFYDLGRVHRARRILSVIHDPQCAMTLHSMLHTPRFAWDEHDVEPYFAYEVRTQVKPLLQLQGISCVGDLYLYQGLGQSLTVKHSDHIILHSYYAHQKFLCEIRPEITKSIYHLAQLPTSAELPKRIAYALPDIHPRFIVGVFGWLTPVKRIPSILASFRRFVLHHILAEDRSKIELRLVGEQRGLMMNIEEFASLNGLMDCIRAPGFVDHGVFETLMQECNLILNLRFPSCGETSGTLMTAKDYGIPIALTRYAAFREERADFFISPESGDEEADILMALQICYKEWKTVHHTRNLRVSNSNYRLKPSLASVLKEIL